MSPPVLLLCLLLLFLLLLLLLLLQRLLLQRVLLQFLLLLDDVFCCNPLLSQEVVRQANEQAALGSQGQTLRSRQQCEHDKSTIEQDRAENRGKMATLERQVSFRSRRSTEWEL